MKVDNGNFITYFLDNVNYKIFKCYLLIIIFDNLKDNYAFYAISGIFLVIMIIKLIFIAYSIQHLKKSMFKNLPTLPKLREDTIKELKRIKNLNKIKILSNPNKRKDEKVNGETITKQKIPKKLSRKNIKKNKGKKKKAHN